MTHVWSPTGPALLACDHTGGCNTTFGCAPACWIWGDELREWAHRHWWTSGPTGDWCPVHGPVRRGRMEVAS